MRSFLELAPSVDPQMQGQGFLFLLKPNSLRLTSGEAVVGYLKIPGEPLAGVIIPREAVVRTEGAGWIYVLNAAGDAFTRDRGRPGSSHGGRLVRDQRCDGRRSCGGDGRAAVALD